MRHATVSRLALVLVLGVTLGAQTKPKEPTPDAMPSISCCLLYTSPSPRD